MSATTCQICGRLIRANSGTIAHHGYKRPGNGWQTASCIGARHLPYEQSCDRLPVAIDTVKEYLVKRESYLAALMSSPPDTLTEYHKSGYGNQVKSVTAARPENFDPATMRRTYRRDQYDAMFFARKSETEQDIKRAQNDLSYLQNRLASWVAPRTAEQQVTVTEFA